MAENETAPTKPAGAQIGKRYRDSVTSCAGICTATAEYLDSDPSARLEWQSQTGIACSEWFDVKRLVAD